MDQLAVQVRAKAIAALRTLGSEVIEGDGTAPRMKGLMGFITAGQTIGAGDMPTSAAAPTLADLPRLVYLVSASEGGVGAGPTCLVAAPKAVRFIVHLLETAGLTPQFVWDPDLDAPVLQFNGLPVYVGQNSTAETKGGTTCTSIWALRMGGRTGVRLLHSTGRSEDYGIDVQDIPMQGTAATIGKFVGGHYALVVPEAESIARLDGCNLASLIGT